MNKLVSKFKYAGLVLITFLMIFGIQSGIYAQEDDILAVSDRTSQVSEAIVAAVTGVTDAANVTNTHLAAITILNLRNKSITALNSGDFSGMTGLTNLNLYGNQLSSLPDGIFKGLTALTTLRLGGNTVDPMQIGVSLEEVGTNEYKVSIPTGAPFATTVSIVLTDGVDSERLLSATVAKGSVESASFTGQSVSGATVEIGGTLPVLPRNHYGYELNIVLTTDVTEEETTSENNAPVFTDSDPATRSIAENTAAATNIGTPIAATDEDTDDTLNYSLSGIDAASFDIVSTSGQLQTKAALDYETKDSYTVTVTVSDSNEGSDTITVTIDITDVVEQETTEETTEETENSAPTFTDDTFTVRSIAENTAAETNIGAVVAATDTDTDDTLTYTLGGRDAASFAIVATTGQLQTKAALDYETKSVYLVSITVSDTADTDTISVVISIIDVADTTISTVSLGVSDRTPEVRDAIVAAVPGVTDAANVTTAHLTAITALDLRNTGITALKANDFSGLTGLTSLNLYGNMLSSLPNGIFSGLTALTSVRLGGNTVDPIPIIVSLEQVSSNQYKVVIPTGAPFDVVVPILLSDGSDRPEGLGTVTVSKGSVKSAVRTVPIVRGTFIDIGALPSLPANHFGYILSKSATCNVTLQVAEAIAAAVPGVEDCRNVSQAQLAAITSLNLSNKSIISLQNNDFTDLLLLTTLNLENNQLSSLPDGIFAGMTSLNTLQLSGNTGAPFSFEVSLEKVGTNQFKAVLPVGAPFEISLPITVTNGSAANSASSITITKGSLDSGAITVTRTLLTTEAVSVDIGTLPSIPTAHNGYTLSKSIDLPLEIFSATNAVPVFTEGPTATRSIAENTAAETNIGSPVSATDANSSDRLVYTLSGTDAASFAIVDSTGQLQTKAALDHETQDSYTVTINVSDGNQSDTIDVTITVSDVVENIAPVFTEGATATRSIDENTIAGTNIGTPVAATDADLDTLIYALGGTDANVFSIANSTGQLQTKLALNFESKQNYKVTVTATDGKGGSDSITVAINITNVVNEGTQQQTREEPVTNNPPVFIEGATAARSIAENTIAGANIGTPVAATDANILDILAYTLIGADAASFDIVGTTGQLKTKAALDFETTTSYSVTVTVFDGENGTDTINVTINVIDVYENVAPVFTEGATATRTTAENTAAATNIGTPVAATDANTLDILAYTLSGTDAASFDIVGTTGQLKTKAALDFETTTSYSVTVTVFDGENGTDTINVTINVIDVYENVAPVFTEGATATRTTAENTAAATNIGTPVAATDANTLDILAYTLSGADAASFDIVGTTGQLQTKAALDFETTTSYSVKITVSDGKNGTDTITVTINVTNVVEGVANNAPVFTEGVATTRSIAENTGSGTNIGSVVTATDVNPGDTLIYTLGGVDAHSFTIVETSGQLQTSAALNYEDKNTYTVTATVSDNKGGTHSIDVTINVTDVNDPPRFVDAPSATITIPENIGSSPIPIGDFNIIDEDMDKLNNYVAGLDGETFRYEFNTGFQVDRQTLAVSYSGRGDVRIFVTPRSNLDYETKTSYSLSLWTRDTKGATGTMNVTINLTDVVNEPPPPPPPTPPTPSPNRTPNFWDSTGNDAASTAREIAENAGSGENIGNPVGASDPDNDTLTYTLGGTDAASFDITSQGQLRTKSVLDVLPFDYETKSSYSITVSVADGRGGTSTISVTINITDKPEAPEFTDGDSTTRTISENSAVDTNIGSAVSATDQDNGDRVTYTLSGADAAAFTVDNGTGQLKTKAALDFETTTSYTVTLTATDKDDLTDSITVTINVRNLDERPSNNAPVFTEGATATRSVAENLVAGTNIGTAVTATDTDTGSTLSYQLSGSDGAAFSIDESTGQLKTNAALNYETKDAYSVTITVTDGALTDTITVTINVTDANDAPVFSDGTSTTRNVNENTDAGTNIGASVIATDTDTSDTLTYTLGGTDAASFVIVDTTGQLQTKAALDFETTASYEVTVTVSDGKGGTDSIAVTISVNNIHENTSGPAFTEYPSTTRSISENTPAGVNIGEPLTATDIDNDILRYYILGSFDYTSFSIDSSTGQLKTKASLDREQKSSYTLQVSVSDGEFSGNIVVDINVTDVNEVTAFAEGESTTRSVAENTSAGVNIGRPVTAIDQDGDALTYTLAGADAASFDIVDTTGLLQVKAALDFETTTSYTFTIIASDGRGGASSITVTINVTDVTTEANNPPEFTDGASTTRSVAENTAAGENIGSAVAATDANHDILTYSLSGADAASFDINDSTGQLRTNAALDFETRSSYNVTITVSDSIIGGTDTITVTIRVTDLEPENTPPVFTDGASTTRTIAEHADEDYESVFEIPFFNIGAPIAATDADDDTLAYEIVEGPDSYRFRIDSSGQLRTPFWIDYEDTPSRSVTITVSDGNGGTDSIDVTVNFTNVNEQPYFGTSSNSSYSGSTTIRHAIHGAVANTNIGDPITASDPDANTTLTYSLSGTDAASFTIDSTTGQLTNNSVLDVDTKASHSVVVTVSDSSLSASINVTINVVKQPVPAVSSRSAAVREAIVNAISDVDSPNDVTATHLANITELDLRNESIASLSAGDFNDLVSLESLDLSGNNLISLPADIFDHLTSLEFLDLSRNRLSSLPEDIFDHLTSLDELLINYNQISSISGDIFENNTNLTVIHLRNNHLSSLPDGIFEGLSSLTRVQLVQDSNEAPDINIDLVAVDDEDGNSQTAKYKVTVHTGSVEDLNVEVWVVQPIGGIKLYISNHQTVRVSTGSVESSEITIDRSEFPSNDSAIYLALRQNKLPLGNITLYDPRIGGFFYRANETELLMLPANEAGAPFADGRESVPVSTELLPNFPNPFNPETWIPYQLSEVSDVSITIYDVRGSVVRELDLGQKTAGYYTDRSRAAHWDGRNTTGERVANGVYFYQLKAGDYSYLRKMLILK